MRKEFELLLANKGYIINYCHEDLIENENDKLAYDFSLSLSSLGYKLDKQSFELINFMNKEDLSKLYFRTINLLKSVKGANVKHVIFYKDFPNMKHYSTDEYYIRALLHYYTSSKDSYGYLGQDIEESFKEKLDDITQLDNISIISEDVAYRMLVKYFTNLLEGKTIISEANRGLLKIFIEEYNNALKPNIIPMRINLIMYIDISLNICKDKKIGDALESINLSFIKTITDVLRLYAVISKGDPSLDGEVSFISLDRKARRIFLDLLDFICEKNNNAVDDMASHEFLWKRALEKLHIGEYRRSYPNAYYVASLIRNGNYRTYNYKIEKAIEDKDEETLYLLLCSRPGVFARNLDSLIRNDNLDNNNILKAFKSIIKKISNPVLISLLNYYKNRNDLSNVRSFMYRKSLNYVIYTCEENRKPIDENIINNLIMMIEKRLIKVYSKQELIDNVYLSDEMKNYMIPTNNRNQSLGYKTVGFCSRIKLDSGENNILRFFTHWKNGNSRVDIDLSVELFDEDYNYLTTVGWHNMYGGHHIQTYHSGDIVTAPNGA